MFGDAASTKAHGALSTGLFFPAYLLPALKLPFRRNRAASPTRRSIPGYSTSPTVPSLSNSPTSITSDSPASPTSSSADTSVFPDFDDLALAAHSRTKAVDTPFRHLRLSRVAAETLRCSTCSTDIAFGAQIVSKGFTGRHGRAYLVSPPSTLPSPSCPGSPTTALAQAVGYGQNLEDLINIRVGRPENRQLVTGAHVVADINCVVCNVKLGWKYVNAKETAQKYKVGKFILETQRVVPYCSWEDAGQDPSTVGAATEEGCVSRRKSSPTRSRWSENLGFSEDEADEDVVMFDSDDEDECEDIFAGTWDPKTVAQRRRSKVTAIGRK